MQINMTAGPFVQGTASPHWRGWRMIFPERTEETIKKMGDAVASLGMWLLRMPGPSAAWSHYTVALITLADIPGVPPAVKKSPEYTHEVMVNAINPEVPEDEMLTGRLPILTPTNHAVQFVGTDQIGDPLLESLAMAFLNGQQMIEPDGIRVEHKTAREYFAAFVRSEAARLIAGEPAPAGASVYRARVLAFDGDADAKTDPTYRTDPRAGQ